MLQKFLGRKRVPLIPASWLNAVANWLNGLHSKTETIRISNSENAVSGGTPSIDIVPEQVAKQIRSALANDFVCKNEKRLIGEGLKWTQSGLVVDKDWIEKQIVQYFKA